MKTCIICIAKMENKYIEEWVNHHLNIGFDTIFICENNNSNGESISDVINNEKVVILDYKDVKGVQPIAYTETFLKFKNDYDWFAFIDCDEFIMIDEKYNNIKELLLEEIFNNADIIRLCPKVYNDNNKLDVENDDYSVLNRFQNEITEKNQFTYFIKSLIKGSIEFNDGHIGPFGYFYNHNLHMVNSCGKKCRGINLSSQDLCFGKGCPHFNPLSGKESEVVENMATTFRMLNPDSPTFFLDLDEQLVRNAVKVLKRLDKDCGVEGKYANLINMSRLLQNSGNAGRQLTQSLLKVNSPTPEEAKENADIVAWFQNDYFAERSKVYENTSEVRSQVAKITSNEYLREVLNPDPEKGERNDLDFDKHLEEGTVICISTAQGTLRALSKFLGYFIILQFQSAVFRRPGTENTRRPHYLYIDEFQTYSTPGFADMLTQGRSYRVASILATQARDQMAMGGGRDGRNFVNLVSTNARNVVLFPGCNNDDTEYYSKNFGEYEKVELQKSISEKKFDLLRGGFTMLGHPTESVKESKKSTAIFSASDLRFQRNSVITYCIVKHKTLQMAKRGIVSYIPQELNQDLNKMIDEYLAQHAWGDDLAVDGDRIPMPDFDGSNQEDDDILHFTDGLDDAGSEGGEDEDILGMPAGASMAEAANDLKDPFAEAVETEF